MRKGEKKWGQRSGEVKRRHSFCSSRGLISCWSSRGAPQPLLEVTLCSWSKPLEMHGPCQSRGALSYPAAQSYNSELHLHSGVIHHKAHSHRYTCLRLCARCILNCNFYKCTIPTFKCFPLLHLFSASAFKSTPTSPAGTLNSSL